MSTWQRKARLIIAVAAVAFAIVVAFAFQRRSTTVAIETPPPTDPAAVMESASGRVFRVNRNKEEVRIEYDRLLSYPDGSTKMLGIKVSTERAGGRTFTVTGKQGEVDDQESRLSVDGDVHLTATDGMTVRTEQVTYTEADGIARAPGATAFSRGRLSGSAMGFTYDKNTDLLVLSDQVVIHVAGSGPGSEPMEVSAGSAELDRQENVIRFPRALKAVRRGETIEADSAIAHLSADEERLETVALRGHSRIAGTTEGRGTLQAMTGHDIDLTYAADGETLARAVVTGDAVVQLAGDGSQAGARIAAGTIDVSLADDGSTPTALTAREGVELILPGAEKTVRTITAETLEAAGKPPAGLASARFQGNVRYRERGPSIDRGARSGVLDAALRPGVAGIDEARFARAVRFADGDVLATAALARYVLDKGTLELAGSEPANPTPRIVNSDIEVGATTIEVTFDGPTVGAAGAVKSVLLPAKPDKEKRAEPDRSMPAPSMLKHDQPVSVTAADLRYDGKRSRATYTGNAQLWQGETTVKADSITIDDATGDLTAGGSPVATTVVLLQEPSVEGGDRARSISAGRAATFKYEEAQRRATYAGDAYVSGPQGEIRAARIELYLKPSGDELDRAEAYENMTLIEQRYKATGSRMTYFNGDGRYVITGAPVTIVDSCGRKTIGRTLILDKATDRITVDGNEQIRTRTTGGGATCR